MGMLMLGGADCRCYEDDLMRTSGRKPHVIYMSPQGKVLTSKSAVRTFAKSKTSLFVCGHYEGVDERVLEEHMWMRRFRIGDYVLTGGELPALAMTDAVCRMMDGVLSDDLCFEEESHFNGLLEYPQYTRPAVWRGRPVPPVLLTGNHAKIEDWRRAQSLLRTKAFRPDLFSQYSMDKREQKLLEALEQEAAGTFSGSDAYNDQRKTDTKIIQQSWRCAQMAGSRISGRLGINPKI